MRKLTTLTLASTLALLLAAAAPLAWTDPPAPNTPNPAADTVAPGDLLCIGVAQLTPDGIETLKTVRVNAAGEVSLFYVGNQNIKGLSFTDAATKIADAYKEKRIVQQTLVSINRLATGEARPLKPGDHVSIRIFELSGPAVWTHRILPISPAGNVGLPLIGQIKLAGLEEAAAEQTVLKHYIEAKILRDAQVSLLRLAPGENTEPTVEPPHHARTSAKSP
jgi:protein involved in polysaccharide export with SLBB domain